ncbi:MAG: hypothetical protein JWO19_2236 [Bryobacterales bacterium]|nr:hypothetical protein [Bryobacterales bacterium]
MLEFRFVFRGLILPVLALASALPLAAQLQTRLSPKTDQAFDDYRTAVEARLDGRPHFPSGLRPGQVEIVPVNTAGSIDVKDGLIHDWIGATIVPGVTVDKTLALLQNYTDYKNIYRVDVSDSKVLRRDGDRWHIYLRMVKKKVLTAVLNGEFDVQYRPLGNNRWSMLSRSTRIAELDGDRELAPGSGYGFLWRLNAYWLIEPRPEGVYLECRSISLSRDIPFGWGLVVKPLVTSVPRESLQETMEATLRALR